MLWSSGHVITEAMAGDNLTIILFLVGTGITFAVAAVSQAGWKHPWLIRGLFGAAALCVAFGLGWPWIKDIWPSVGHEISRVATNPVAWFVVLILGLTASLFLRPAQFTFVPEISPASEPATSSVDSAPIPTPVKKEAPSQDDLRNLYGTKSVETRAPESSKESNRPKPTAEAESVDEKIPVDIKIKKSIATIPHIDFSSEIDTNILYAQTEEKSLFLKFLPDTKRKNEDAILLILFGYKLLQDLNDVGTNHVTWCLQKSGCTKYSTNIALWAAMSAVDGLAPIDAEEVARSYIDAGYIVKVGLSRRPKGYLRLTQAGANKAADLMADLIRRA